MFKFLDKIPNSFYVALAIGMLFFILFGMAYGCSHTEYDRPTYRASYEENY